MNWYTKNLIYFLSDLYVYEVSVTLHTWISTLVGKRISKFMKFIHRRITALTQCVVLQYHGDCDIAVSGNWDPRHHQRPIISGHQILVVEKSKNLLLGAIFFDVTLVPFFFIHTDVYVNVTIPILKEIWNICDFVPIPCWFYFFFSTNNNSVFVKCV